MDIIAITTSSDFGSVSLVAKGKYYTREFNSRDTGHSSSLLPAIKELMEQAEADVKDFSGVAVDAGPGSFTGIRLAVSCAEAFSLSAGMKKAGISSLDIIAEAACPALEEKDKSGFYVAVDAGRSEFYSSHFRIGSSGLPEKLTPDSLVPGQDMESKALQLPVFGYLQKRNTSCAFKERIKNVFPRSEHLAAIALRRNEWQADVLRPHYIRQPNVTVKEKKNQC
jgi:tRNA threonylcarbamoyl adenosine modification protein YeaZ